MKKLMAFGSSLFLFASMASAQVSIDLAGSAGYPTTFGDTLTFTDSGVTVTASAWGYRGDSSTGSFEIAGLGQFATGLGSSDQDEGLGANSPNHQVDNVGLNDFVLFVFDQPVDVSAFSIDPYTVADRDVTYWAGNVSTPLSLAGISYDGLAGIGFGSQVDDLDGSAPSYASRTVALGSNATQVNAILFGALVQGPNADAYADEFKIRSLTVVPEPSAFALCGIGLAVLFMRRRN